MDPQNQTKGVTNMDDHHNDNNSDVELIKYMEFASTFFDLLENDDQADNIANTIAISNLIQVQANIVMQVATAAADLDESLSDEEDGEVWGGSQPRKAPNKKCDFEGAYNKLKQHYFSGPASLYDETDFECRFRMPRIVFNRIHNALVGEEPFLQNYSCICMKPAGIHPLCRLVACLRKLCYGDADDVLDEYFQMSETVLNDSMKAFTRLIIDIFGNEYLNRCPN
jgi:hypothetical protein